VIRNDIENDIPMSNECLNKIKVGSKFIMWMNKLFGLSNKLVK